MVAFVPISLDDDLQAEMVLLEAQGRSRSCPSCCGPTRTTLIVDGQQLLSFCSNDYLGLSCHPSLASAAADAIKRSGFGASASRLVSGDLPEHRELETALSDFLDMEAVLLFPTGYQTNLGVLTYFSATMPTMPAYLMPVASLAPAQPITGIWISLIWKRSLLTWLPLRAASSS
jgi:8-amino-7-oxononanoate synthase